MHVAFYVVLTLLLGHTPPLAIRPASALAYILKKPLGRMPEGLRGGGYLLFHFRSIIGVVRFNFSVRNGKRWSPHAMATLVSLSAATAAL